MHACSWLVAAFFAMQIVVVAPVFGQTAKSGASAPGPEAKRTPPPRQPQSPPVSHAALTEQINQNTVTIITGTPAGTYLAVAHDMSAVLDEGDLLQDLRILPVTGKGSVQNVRDILHLRGVDLGIVQSDVMTHFKQSGELGNNIDQRLVYITKLYNEEMHLLANAQIHDIKELAGKKVNFAERNSGTQFSSRIIFDLIGIKVEEVNMGQTDALAKIKSGEIAATVFIVGRPAAVLARLPKDSGLRLLPVPYSQPLEDNSYFPAALTSQDYPALIAEGQRVDTIAVGAVLANYNWPRGTDRYRRVSRFIDAFFGRFSEFQAVPRHPKWQEVNLTANLRGWRRFAGAQDWLDRASTSATGGVNPTPARPQDARAAQKDPATQEKLFRQFLEWNKTQGKPR